MSHRTVNCDFQAVSPIAAFDEQNATGLDFPNDRLVLNPVPSTVADILNGFSLFDQSDMSVTLEQNFSPPATEAEQASDWLVATLKLAAEHAQLD